MQEKSRNILMLSLLLALGSMALSQLLFPAHYEALDDFFFQLQLRGQGIAQHPTGDTWFSNILLMQPLSWLYQSVPTINWYPLNLSLCQLFAFAGIALSLLTRFGPKAGSALYAAYFLFIGTFIASNLQFTSTAALLVQSGVLLAFCALNEGRGGRVQILIGALFALFASLIRYESFWLVLIISLFTLFCLAAPLTSPLADKMKALRWLLITAALGCALSGVNSFYYDSKPEYRGLQQFMRVFFLASDCNFAPDSNADSGGALSTNDLALVRSYFVDDNGVFTTEALTEVLKHGHHPVSWQLVGSAARQYVLPLVVFCLALGYLQDRTLFTGKRLAIWIAGVTTLILALSIYAKMPPRLYFSIADCVYTIILFCLDPDKLQDFAARFTSMSKSQKAAVWLCGLLVLGIRSAYVWDQLRPASQKAIRLNGQLKEYLSSTKPDFEHFYVVLTAQNPYMHFLPWDDPDRYWKNFKMYHTHRLPSWKDVLPLSLRWDQDLSGLLLAPQTLVMSNDYQNGLLRRFYREHYGKVLDFAPVCLRPEINLQVYRVSLSK